jgi:hypothetical protein
MREIIALTIMRTHGCVKCRSQKCLQYYMKHRTKAINNGVLHYDNHANNTNNTIKSRRQFKKYILSMSDQQFIDYLKQQGFLCEDTTS